MTNEIWVYGNNMTDMKMLTETFLNIVKNVQQKRKRKNIRKALL